MRKFLIVFCLLGCFLSAGERSLGTVTLGESLESVAKKYSFAGQRSSRQVTGMPFPLNVGNREQVTLIQDPNSRIYFYLDSQNTVIAVGLFAENDSSDNRIYETGAGLRQSDGLLEMRVLYGNPLKISDFEFKDPFGDRVTRRIYYYPDIIIQTRKINNLPEQIDNILVCKYDMRRVLQEKDFPLSRPGQ